jgi:hypothetical protein
LATTWPNPIPQYMPIPSTSSRSEQSEFRRSARRFAEVHPEIVNHYARHGGTRRNNVSCDVGRVCYRCLEGQNPPYAPEAYQPPVPGCNVPTRLYHCSNHPEDQYGSGHPSGQLCDVCQDCSHCVSRGCESYRGPPLMSMPGPDGLLHHESCIQAQADPYCSCHNCDERTRGYFGSPKGSYTRERARDWAKEI